MRSAEVAMRRIEGFFFFTGISLKVLETKNTRVLPGGFDDNDEGNHGFILRSRIVTQFLF